MVECLERWRCWFTRCSYRAGESLASRGAAAALVMLLGACSSSVVPDPVVVPGRIDGYREGGPAVDLATNGDMLSIEILSFGNACREKGFLDISTDTGARTVSVAVYDYLFPGPCDDVLLEFQHSSSLRLDVPGGWTIAVAGQDISGEDVRLAFSVNISP